MFTLNTLLLAFGTVGALSVPAANEDGQISRRYVTPSSQGQNNGFFYSMWSDGSGDVNYNNGPAGQYDLTWTNSGDVVVGKGFKTGSDRVITYSADYQPTGYSFLSVYGWFKNPLVEYYICENWGAGDPRTGDGMTKLGSFQSDGSNYDVYKHLQQNVPSIQGTATFYQYWSIRTDRRSSGSITTANHYNYWKSLGLQIGDFDYQIMATEGVKSSGKSTVTVSEGGAVAPQAAAPASSSSAAAPPASSVKPVSSATHAVPSSAPVSVAAEQPSSKPAVVATTMSVVPVAASSPAYSAAPSVAPSAAPSAASSEAAPVPSVPSSAVYSAAPSATETPEASSATGGFPGFGGYSPAAGSPRGTPRYTPGHYTPGATPTPRFGRHGHHGHGHFHGEHPHMSGSPYQGGMPKAGAEGTPAVSAAAAKETCTEESGKY